MPWALGSRRNEPPRLRHCVVALGSRPDVEDLVGVQSNLTGADTLHADLLPLLHRGPPGSVDAHEAAAEGRPARWPGFSHRIGLHTHATMGFTGGSPRRAASVFIRPIITRYSSHTSWATRQHASSVSK